jgi:hypothetical protein
MNSSLKLNRTASTKTGIVPKVPAARYEEDIKGMIQDWYEKHGNAELPTDLKTLATKLGIPIYTPADTDHTSPGRRGKHEKTSISTPTALDGAIQGSLEGWQFVLSGTWPNLGGGMGLKAGKHWQKARIEQFGGRVTSSISGVTDFLVVGDSPGPKKLEEVTYKGIKVIDTKTLNCMIHGGLACAKVASLKAPPKGALVHPMGHQVQHQSQTPTLTKQATSGPAEPEGNSEVDHNNE